MSGLTFIEGIGHADHCQVSVTHRPKTFRYVWHHRLPQVCGGKTEVDNLISVCDSCHMTIHILMWNIANNVVLPHNVNREQLDQAHRGYNEAVTAGTVDKIPNEGGHASAVA